jgi:hypothetical protein
MSWLINLISGGLIGKIGKQINEYHATSLKAANESERINANRSANVLQAQKDVLVAEARSQWNVIARVFAGLPLMLFVWKVIVWDKLLSLGVTDALDPKMWNLLYLVYSFYFVNEIANLIAKRK